MRKLIMMMVVVATSISMFAQEGRNVSKTSNIYVGGGVAFESTSDETAIAIVPEIGYKMSDKWGIGVRLGYGSEGSGDSKNTIFSFKPYVRHSLLSFGQVGVILDYQLLYQNEGMKDNKTNTFGLGVAPGLAVNLNSKLSVVTHIGFVGYTSAKLDVEGAEAVNKFSIGASSENLGLSIYYNF